MFEAASRLPHTIVDLPRPAERRILDVVGLLLELPLGSLGRPDLLRVAMHPAVARRFPDVDPEDWLALCEALEIVRGADRADQAASYLTRDRTSWEQGLRRLALGAFLTGPRSGEERPFVLDGEEVLPFDLPPGLEPAARALGTIARELIAFAHAARGAPAPFERHATLLRRTIAETIFPEPGDEEAALGDALRALVDVAAFVPADLAVSFRVAAELVKARLGGTPRRHRSPEGVTVASFVPMRALPFRMIFVAGLDERVFPAPDGVRALDLRSGAPRPGDVSAREQDQHMFLETLLAARERLTLSYVARDAVTGEPRAPSSVIEALLDLAARNAPESASEDASGAKERAPSEMLRARPPLARHEDPAACAVIPAAGARATGGGAGRVAAAGRRRRAPAPARSASCAARSAPTPGPASPPILDWVAATAGRRGDARPPRPDADRSAPLPRVPAASLRPRAVAGRRRRRRDGRGRGGASASTSRSTRHGRRPFRFFATCSPSCWPSPAQRRRPSGSSKRTIARPPSRRSRGSSPTASSAAPCGSVTWASSAAGATASFRRPAAC